MKFLAMALSLMSLSAFAKPSFYCEIVTGTNEETEIVAGASMYKGFTFKGKIENWKRVGDKKEAELIKTSNFKLVAVRNATSTPAGQLPPDHEDFELPAIELRSNQKGQVAALAFTKNGTEKANLHFDFPETKVTGFINMKKCTASGFWESWDQLEKPVEAFSDEVACNTKFYTIRREKNVRFNDLLTSGLFNQLVSLDGYTLFGGKSYNFSRLTVKKNESELFFVEPKSLGNTQLKAEVRSKTFVGLGLQLNCNSNLK